MTRGRFTRRFYGKSGRQLAIAAVAATIAWYLGRHALWWLTLATVPRWSSAPRHWAAQHPEYQFAGIEWRIALVCAILTFAVFFFRPPTQQTAIGVAHFFYGSMHHAVRRLLAVVIPMAIVWYVVRQAFWFFGFLGSNHQYYRIGSPDPFPNMSHNAVIAAWIVVFVAGPNLMVQHLMRAWADAVAERENVSPTFLRLASGVSTGLDMPALPGCLPMVLIGLFGAPFFALWLVWQTAIALGTLLGVRFLLGRLLASRQAPIYDITTGLQM